MNNTNLLTAIVAPLPSMSEASVAQAKEAETLIRGLPQIVLTTDHSLHAGVYARTVLIPKGASIVGTLIKRSTNLIIAGHVIVFVGNDQAVEYQGYAVLAASANRKQVFIAKEDTYLTMFFATNATTIGEAEAEFTDEVDILMSRQAGSINNITITGE